MVFLNRPISAFFVTITIALVAWALWVTLRGERKKPQEAQATATQSH